MNLYLVTGREQFRIIRTRANVTRHQLLANSYPALVNGSQVERTGTAEGDLLRGI